MEKKPRSPLDDLGIPQASPRLEDEVHMEDPHSMDCNNLSHEEWVVRVYMDSPMDYRHNIGVPQILDQYKLDREARKNA